MTDSKKMHADMTTELKKLIEFKKKTGQDLLLNALQQKANKEYKKSSFESGLTLELNEKYNQLIEAINRLKGNKMPLEEYYFWAKELKLIK